MQRGTFGAPRRGGGLPLAGGAQQHDTPACACCRGLSITGQHAWFEPPPHAHPPRQATTFTPRGSTALTTNCSPRPSPTSTRLPACRCSLRARGREGAGCGSRRAEAPPPPPGTRTAPHTPPPPPRPTHPASCPGMRCWGTTIMVTAPLCALTTRTARWGPACARPCTRRAQLGAGGRWRRAGHGCVCGGGGGGGGGGGRLQS